MKNLPYCYQVGNVSSQQLNAGNVIKKEAVNVQTTQMDITWTEDPPIL
jgi:hypothetical protein